VPGARIALHGEQPLVAVDVGVRAIAKHLGEWGGKVLGVSFRSTNRSSSCQIDNEEERFA
jgi:hypothetical protein